MTYEIQYKRYLFRRVLKKLIGHSYNTEIDKFTVYYEGGDIEEIPRWSRCHVYLGESFVVFMDRKNKAKQNEDVQPVQE